MSQSSLAVQPSRDAVRTLHRRLLRWYAAAARDLPWRQTTDPYEILVAEVMLQQTGVGRVLPVYESFLNRFPTARALADAPASDVIRAWSGMGYNRRAVNLRRAAQIIVKEHGGRVPDDLEDLQRLPGIGQYTAAAAACFAFHKPTAVMDTNIRRVLGRVLTGPDPISAQEGWRLARTVVPVDGAEASAWHQALIDLGASVCTAARPACGGCPLSAECAARPTFDAHQQAPASRPRKRLKTRRSTSGTASPHTNQADEASTRATYPPTDTVRKPARVAEDRPSSGGWIGTSRYYRGRLVEALRGQPDGAMSLRDLGPIVRDDYTPESHEHWLLDVINGLERDGLVRRSETGVELPA